MGRMYRIILMHTQSDFSPYLDIVTDELDCLYWEGIEVKAANTEEVFNCHAMLLSLITDYRGKPELFRVAQSPAFVGACYICEQIGIRMCEGTTKCIYPGECNSAILWCPFNCQQVSHAAHTS
jgi:hypothetical protein